MRIGIAGAHRTGKTTLAREVAELTGHHFVEGSATPSFLRYNCKPTDDLSLSKRIVIQQHILNRWTAEMSNDSVTDRTPLDFIAYLASEVNTSDYQSLSDIGVGVIEAYIDKCMSRLSSLDAIFIVPPAVEIVYDDSKGICDKLMVERIHALIVGYAELSEHPRVFLLDRGMTDLNDRVKYVTGILESIKSRAINHDSVMPAA
ncbi:TPA: AAA family ATPase [Vibrio parahaemolyticus]